MSFTHSLSPSFLSLLSLNHLTSPSIHLFTLFLAFDEQSPYEILRIDLSRRSSCSLGFSLIQASDTQRSALLVRSLTPNGIADNDGRLRVDDRLLQVRGTFCLFQLLEASVLSKLSGIFIYSNLKFQ